MTATLETIQPQDLALAREKACQILQRAQADASFHRKVVQNPAGILKAFGLSESAAPNLARETGEHHIEGGSTAPLYDICPVTCRSTFVTTSIGSPDQLRPA